MANKLSGLGKGLGALLAGAEEEYDLNQSVGTVAQEIDIASIIPNANQPRKVFDETALNELVNSIRVHGVITPIILVRRADKYMIIAGERRWRAAKRAGLIKIPAIVRDYTDKEIKEISLIENLQREDLNPIETANAIKQLMDEYKYTQEQVAERIGKSRSAVTNTLGLLTLDGQVAELIASGRLSAGHAKVLIPVERSHQYQLAMKAADGKMSVRKFEECVKSFKNPEKVEKKPEQSLELRDLIKRMQRVFATKVSAIGNDKKGRIYIDYYTRDDLDRIVELLDSVEKI
ncbi:MAG: ParB/RepB/Spo0J family partition protein [Clostridia bacterium]|nr:ParB/RepB/Spo0J family partition protein [Clostridia bacterium]